MGIRQLQLYQAVYIFMTSPALPENILKSDLPVSVEKSFASSSFLAPAYAPFLSTIPDHHHG